MPGYCDTTEQKTWHEHQLEHLLECARIWKFFYDLETQEFVDSRSTSFEGLSFQIKLYFNSTTFLLCHRSDILLSFSFKSSSWHSCAPGHVVWTLATVLLFSVSAEITVHSFLLKGCGCQTDDSFNGWLVALCGYWAFSEHRCFASDESMLCLH